VAGGLDLANLFPDGNSGGGWAPGLGGDALGTCGCWRWNWWAGVFAVWCRRHRGGRLGSWFGRHGFGRGWLAGYRLDWNNRRLDRNNRGLDWDDRWLNWNNRRLDRNNRGLDWDDRWLDWSNGGLHGSGSRLGCRARGWLDCRGGG
jgi:hypothetical protein